MTNLSYSVDKLWPKVWHGDKRQSMRATTAWDPKAKVVKQKPQWKQVKAKLAAQKPVYLDIGWKLRSPKDGFKMFIAGAESVDLFTLGSLSKQDWRNDGFDNSEEGFAWFTKTYPHHKLINDHKIESFEIALIKYGPGTCDKCAFAGYCQNYMKTHNMDHFYIKWSDGYLCPGFFPKIRKSLWKLPRFLDIGLITDTPKKPIVAVETWMAWNCRECKFKHSLEPGVGVTFDHRTDVWCEHDSSSRHDYDDEITTLWHYVKDQGRWANEICPMRQEGTSLIDYYENDYSEEEREW